MFEAYLGKHLSRGRNFMQLMARPAGPGDVNPHVFDGDCDATEARLVLEEVRGKHVAWERASAVSNAFRGIDYRGLIHDPGGRVDTRSSLPGNYDNPPRAGFTRIARLPIANSMFPCEEHRFLTGNATFRTMHSTRC